jgi:pimeloyl-ACP methyl ester carboxylesterase
MKTHTTVGSVRSADGTSIAFERAGTGPALILVDAASGFRGFGPMGPLAELLSTSFNVYTYDRRGRGESGDTEPYAMEREIDDLAALITEAGGSAFVYGFSSGALLGVQAAVHGLSIPKLALLEPPIGTDAEQATKPNPLAAELEALVAAGHRGDAVEHFQTSIGVPAEMVAGMRDAPFWPVMEGLAHTLVYDVTITQATTLEDVAKVTVPTLVIDSQGSTGNLSVWARAVVEALPNGTHRSLAGEWHGVAPEDLAPVLSEFFTD